VTVENEDKKDSAGVPPVMRIARIVRVLIVVAVAASLLYLYGRYRFRRIPGDCESMISAFLPGERVLVDLWVRNPESLPRGGVIIYNAPGEGVRIGRVVGLPGERVEISGGLVRVNGQPLSEGIFPHQGIFPVRRSWPAVEVEAGRVYVLGDATYSGAGDSRRLGTLARESIRGRIICKF